MRPKKFFCLSLSRFAQASMATLIAIVLAGAAGADTIEEIFIKDGTAQNVSRGRWGSCAAGATCFSGKHGSGRRRNGTHYLPGLDTFDDLAFSSPCPPSVVSCHGIGSNWVADLLNNDFVDVLTLATMPTSGSPVGFAGGSITGVGVAPGAAVRNPTVYSNLSGRITPVLELSSLALLGPGVLGCMGFALLWRRRKAAHEQAFCQWRRAHHF